MSVDTKDSSEAKDRSEARAIDGTVHGGDRGGSAVGGEDSEGGEGEGEASALRRSEEGGVVWFACVTCGRRWTHHGTALRHTATHTDAKDFGCTTCGRRFRERSALLRHERMHTNKKPFPCTECDMAFRTSHNLTQHMMKHTDSRAFECGQCAKRFRTRQKRDRHERTHEAGGRNHAGPVICNRCGRIFATPAGCANHGRTCRATAPADRDDITQLPPTNTLSTAIQRIGAVLLTKQS